MARAGDVAALKRGGVAHVEQLGVAPLINSAASATPIFLNAIGCVIAVALAARGRCAPAGPDRPAGSGCGHPPKDVPR